MEVRSLIKNHIEKELLHRNDLPLEDETPLIDGGYLTSLQAIELVMFLEDRFQVQIDPEDVNEQEFYSVATIAGLVEGRLG